MVSNPKMQALLSGVAGAWLAYGIATAREIPSTALAVLQWVLLIGCVIGFVGALRQVLGGRG